MHVLSRTQNFCRMDLENISYFVDPIDSIQYIGNQLFSTRVVSFMDVPSTEQAPIMEPCCQNSLNNYFDSLQSDPCHRFDYDSTHQSMKGRHQKTQTISVIQYINIHHSIKQAPVTLEKRYR